MAHDKLHAAGGRQCVNLLTQLDAFNTKYLPELMNGGKHIVINDVNEHRLRIRNIWQKKPETIDEFITGTPSLSEENKQLVLSWKKCIKGDFIVVFWSSKIGHIF